MGSWHLSALWSAVSRNKSTNFLTHCRVAFTDVLPINHIFLPSWNGSRSVTEMDRSPRFSIFRILVVFLTLGELLTAFQAESAEPLSAPPSLEATTNFDLVLPRTALGRDYLMSASLIPQAVAATSRGLGGRVVRFELYHDGVDLYEATEGLVVTPDLPTRRLVATVPIVSQDDSKIVIDFNHGMRRVFTDSWIGLEASGRDDVLEVPQSRVFKMDRENEYLVIRQAVQGRNRELGANEEARYEVRYFFSPYTSGAVPPQEQNNYDSRYARFFQTQPVIEPTTGRAAGKIARFDTNKPIDFYYSANTPRDYVEAVRDGILYWNRAFGKELIRASQAPEGVTAPDARYNLVQWVPWDDAGFAYADILLDPRTGESKHGQAYMTSVFAIEGRASARRLLRAMLDASGDKKPEKRGTATTKPSWAPHVFGAGPSCDIAPEEFAAQYAQGLAELLASETLTDAAVLRASQDYVREVVAHEVGHIMGLRHNFAGSLASTLSHQALENWFKAYLLGQSLDGYTNQFSSASMMEYNPFRAAVFVGWKIRTSSEVLPHDKAAIQWGYFGSNEPREKKLLFGSDEEAGVFGDVIRFDYGTEPIVAAYGEISSTLRNLPALIIETFIAARAPRDPRDQIPLSRVNLSARSYARSVAARFASELFWLRSTSRSLRVENQFDFVGDLNERERAQAHWKSANEQVEKLGGVDRTFFGFVPVDLKLDLKEEPKGVPVAEKISAAALTSRVEKLLEAPAYTNFVGLDEKKYSFTKEEKQLIVERARTFFKEFEKDVVRETLVRLEDAPRTLGYAAHEALQEDDLTAKLEHRIIDLARTVITEKDEEKRLKGKVDKGLVEVIDFKYDNETRVAAAKALNDRTGSYRAWSVDAKSDLNKALKDEVEGALNIPNFKDFKESSLTRPLREWYLRQLDLLNLLPPKPPGR